jgi:hypothetical protein
MAIITYNRCGLNARPMKRYPPFSDDKERGYTFRLRSSNSDGRSADLPDRAGYRHLLVRGFNKVRGEWSLMTLCYNFTRVLNILGFERFGACMVAKMFLVHEHALVAALHCIQLALKAFRAQIISWFAISRLGPDPAY